jgi:hypothetical protein
VNPGRAIAIVVAVVLAMLAVAQATDPALLGISPVAARWLGIVSAGLGVLAGFLPPVHRLSDPSSGPDSDPTADPAFVDAVADALLAKRAEAIARQHPRGVQEAPAAPSATAGAEWH